MIDLKPIKDRLGAATSGCWCWSPDLKAPSIDGDEEFLIVEYDWESNDPELVGTARTECSASLIACAPRDLAALVAEVERLKIENDSQDLRICYLLDEADRRIDEDIRQRNVSTGRPAETVRNIDRLQAEVERLRGAITRHRDITLRRLAWPSATDEELWRVLDEA